MIEYSRQPSTARVLCGVAAINLAALSIGGCAEDRNSQSGEQKSCELGQNVTFSPFSKIKHDWQTRALAIENQPIVDRDYRVSLRDRLQDGPRSMALDGVLTPDTFSELALAGLIAENDRSASAIVRLSHSREVIQFIASHPLDRSADILSAALSDELALRNDPEVIAIIKNAKNITDPNWKPGCAEHSSLYAALVSLRLAERGVPEQGITFALVTGAYLTDDGLSNLHQWIESGDSIYDPSMMINGSGSVLLKSDERYVSIISSLSTVIPTDPDSFARSRKVRLLRAPDSNQKAQALSDTSP